MGSYAISVNETKCRKSLEKVNTAMDNAIKKMGKKGNGDTSTVIGAIEKLNKGLYGTKELQDTYEKFNKDLKALQNSLKVVDDGFQAIDKVV